MRLSVRSSLILGIFVTGLVVTTALAVVGVVMVYRTIEHDAQARVAHDLRVVEALYAQRVSTLVRRVGADVAGLDPASPSLARQLAAIRRDRGLDVLNVCAPDGRPIAGTYAPGAGPVQVDRDPVLRQALTGRPAGGSVRLDATRLQREGGAALAAAAVVRATDSDGVVTDAALAKWIAAPLLDADGRVTAVAYGGRLVNHDLEFVKELRSFVYGDELYEGKPVGTVTLFFDDVRVATNVLGPDQRPALGTRVSQAVRERVLERGETWNDRAWVVDAWYLSAYAPLRDPDGGSVGMLYVGVLEAPYADQRARSLAVFAVVALGLFGLQALFGVVLARRITGPLAQLGDAADRMARADWGDPLDVRAAHAEIDRLARLFERMRAAIHERDQHLEAQRGELVETNARLATTNQNYMATLGFVTHELKAPMASIQSMISAMLQSAPEGLPETTRSFLTRIRRNCSELQDMVKNYLDLSRAERGELVAKPGPCDLVADVLEPSLAQARTELDARVMHLEVRAPERLDWVADADLLRIALSNYLSNAAKYGRDGGSVAVTVEADETSVRFWVRNQGEGFTPDEAAQLFTKFTRLKNATTRSRKGSGLGLYLCHAIAELHGGRAWAESEPGQWACFHLEIPVIRS